MWQMLESLASVLAPLQPLLSLSLLLLQLWVLWIVSRLNVSRGLSVRSRHLSVLAGTVASMVLHHLKLQPLPPVLPPNSIGPTSPPFSVPAPHLQRPLTPQGSLAQLEARREQIRALRSQLRASGLPDSSLLQESERPQPQPEASLKLS